MNRPAHVHLIRISGVAFLIATLALRSSPSGQQQPVCPPGVGQLAYQASTDDSAGGSNVDIYTTCVNGSGQRRLTNSPGLDAAPVWSPDGRQITFHSNPSRARRESIPAVAIHVMNADGSGIRRVVDRFGMNPSWSPDGQWLAFVSLPDDLSSEEASDLERWSARRDIFVVRSDGTGLRNLTNAAGSDNYPAWSPDGRQIAFSSRRVEGEDWTEIYVINADGSGSRKLTFNKLRVEGCCEEAAPTWSPDSQWLAFISKRDGNSEVYKMRRDGSEQTRLTRDSLFDGFPAWSGDGNHVVFQKHRVAASDGTPRGPDNLYIMRADGTGERPLGIAGSRASWRWR